MRNFLIALLFAAMPLGPQSRRPMRRRNSISAASTAWPYGTVELVQPAPPLATELAEKAEAALVRLDDGRSITVVLRLLQHVSPASAYAWSAARKACASSGPEGRVRLTQFVADVNVQERSETAPTRALVRLKG